MSTERALSGARFLVGLLMAAFVGCSGGSSFTTDASAPSDTDDSGSTVVVNPSPRGSMGDAAAGDAAPVNSVPVDAAATDATIPDAAAAPTCTTGELACDGGCVPNDSTHCGACGSPCMSPDGGVSSCVATGGTYQCVVACGTNTTHCGDACVDTQTDRNNCGRCGHACLAGTCTAGSCQSWVVANASASNAGLLVPRAGSGSVTGGHFDLAADSKNVAWVDQSQGVLQASATAGPSAPIVNLAPLQYSTTSTPAFLAMANGVVAWTVWDVNNGISIYKATEGTQNSGVAIASLGATTAGDVPLGLALDGTAQNAYFLDSFNVSGANPTGLGLYKCDLGAKSCSNVHTAGIAGELLGDDVAVAGTNLFWTDSSRGDLWRADYSHNSVSTIESNQHGPCLLVVDETYVYWVNVTLGDADAGTSSSFTINRTPQGTPGPITTVVNAMGGILLGIAIDGAYLYLGGFDATKQYAFLDYVPVDGSAQPQTLKSGQSAVALAAGGGAIFWLNSSDNTIDGIAAP